MPACESCQDQTDDARDYSQKYNVDRCKVFQVLIFRENFSPYPPRTATEAHPTEQGCVDQKQDECFVVVQANTCGQPRTVVIHLQHTSLTRRTVMRSIRLRSLAFFTVAGGASRGHCNGLDNVGVVGIFDSREDGVFHVTASGFG